MASSSSCVLVFLCHVAFLYFILSMHERVFSFPFLIQRRRKGKEILRIFHKMLNYISCYIDLLVLMPNNSYQHVIVVAQIDSIEAFFWKALLLFVKRCFVWIIIYFQYICIKFRRKTSYCMKGKRFIPIKGNFHWKYCIRITSHVCYWILFWKGNNFNLERHR